MLFLHNTSRVEDEPYPTLLLDKGFRGFPSLAFMSADGDVLAEPPGREVADFESGLAAVTRWQRLAGKDSRTAAEDAELLLIELELGKLSLEDARARRDALEDVTAEQAASLENELLLLEVADIRAAAQSKASQLRGDREKMRTVLDEANARLAAMVEAGRVPTGPRASPFWFGVIAHASSTENVALFEQALDTLQTLHGDDERYARMLGQLGQRLVELRGDGEK